MPSPLISILKQITTHRPNVTQILHFLPRSTTNTEVTESTDTFGPSRTLTMSTVLEVNTRGPSEHPSKNSNRRPTLSTIIIVAVIVAILVILVILLHLALRFCRTRHIRDIREQFNRVELRHLQKFTD